MCLPNNRPVSPRLSVCIVDVTGGVKILLLSNSFHIPRLSQPDTTRPTPWTERGSCGRRGFLAASTAATPVVRCALFCSWNRELFGLEILKSLCPTPWKANWRDVITKAKVAENNLHHVIIILPEPQSYHIFTIVSITTAWTKLILFRTSNQHIFTIISITTAWYCFEYSSVISSQNKLCTFSCSNLCK